MADINDPQNRGVLIESYCLQRSSTPSELCNELFEYTQKNVERATMLIGPMAGSFLQFLIRTTSASKILEVGTFTGYSALVMAEALPENGEVTTLDINPENVAIAQTFWKRSMAGKKIRSLIGPAVESMKNLTGPYDLILIDADKPSYPQYVKRGLELLSDRGLMVLDNVLWSGKVADPTQSDPETVALREITQWAKQQSQLQTVMLPIRDGLFVIQKKS